MRILSYLIIGLLAGAPIGLVYSLGTSTALLYFLVVLNLLGWSVAAFNLISKNSLQKLITKSLSKLSTIYGKDIGVSDVSSVLDQIFKELEIASLAISNLKLSSRKELSETLQFIATTAQRVLRARSVEIMLHDSESDHYHSAFIATDQRLGGAKIDYISIKESITFAGNTVGTIKFKFHEERELALEEERLMQLTSLQAGIAVLNEQFTGEILKLQSVSDEAKRARTGFLANLSHEIRGPLGNILNCIEITVEELCGPISDKQREALSLARNNGEHLLELINDVLDYAKVQSGRMNSKPEPLSSKELLDSVTKLVRSQAQKKHHYLAVRDDSEDIGFSCDPRQVRQILINLLTNSIKYTQDGGRIEVWAEKQGQNRVRLNVKDNGIGISEEDKPKVFSAFDRIETGYASEQLGTGLGMSLTKSLVELNNGGIGFESELSQGSHFWVDFDQASLADVAEDSIKEAPPKGKGEHVIILENDENERKMLAKYLNHIGFSVFESDSISAVKLEANNPDTKLLILSDHFKENIPELEKSISASANAKIPIILLSSHAFTQDVEHFIKLGVARCLSKPVPLTQLGASCRTLIDQSEEINKSFVKDRGELEKKAPSGSTPPDEAIH